MAYFWTDRVQSVDWKSTRKQQRHRYSWTSKILTGRTPGCVIIHLKQPLLLCLEVSITGMPRDSICLLFFFFLIWTDLFLYEVPGMIKAREREHKSCSRHVNCQTQGSCKTIWVTNFVTIIGANQINVWNMTCWSCICNLPYWYQQVNWKRSRIEQPRSVR